MALRTDEAGVEAEDEADRRCVMGRIAKVHANACARVPTGKLLMVLKRGAQCTDGATKGMHVIKVGTHWATRKDLQRGFLF